MINEGNKASRLMKIRMFICTSEIKIVKQRLTSLAFFVHSLTVTGDTGFLFLIDLQAEDGDRGNITVSMQIPIP
jgi:hypothetical protein